MNLAYEKAIRSFGADSVMFYKVFGGLFAKKFNVYMYPTFVYVESKKDAPTVVDSNEKGLNLKRVTGATFGENQISQLVLDCVEGSYDKTHMESHDHFQDFISDLDAEDLAPEVILQHLRTSTD